MKPTLRVLILIGVAVLQLKNVQSLQAQILFKKLPGLEPVNTTVPAITQDPKGIIWYITGDELDSYDGYNVTSYKHDALNPNTPTGFRPECVYADREGIIWIGNFGGGLDRFDPITGVFKHYTHDPKDPGSIAQDIVTVIFEDRDGIFWIGTHGGLDKMDRSTGKFTHYPHNDKDPSSISNNQVRAVYQDREGTLWIGTGSPWIGSNTTSGESGVPGEGGLNKMDIKTGKFVRYMHDPNDPHSLINNKVRAIFEDSHGNFWVGTADDGLHLMDRKTGTFQRYPYDPKHPEQLSRAPLIKQAVFDHISFITEDPSGAIWIGTAAGGISRYDPETKKIKHYNNDTLSGFMDNEPFGHLISRDGLLWITTLHGNIFTVNPFSINIPRSQSMGATMSFYKANDSVMWRGTEDRGLIKTNLKNNSETQVIDKGAVYHMVRDDKGNLWMSHYANGVYKLNLKTEKLTQYKHDGQNNNSLGNDTCYVVYVDRAHFVWVGTTEGLDKFDPETNKFTHYRHDPGDTSSISGNFIISLREDKEGSLWAGTANNNGINKLDTKTGKFNRFLKGTNIFDILEDHEGTVLAAAGDRVYRYVRSSNNFVEILDPLTGKSASAYGLVEDIRQNLWLTGNKGFMRLNLDKAESFTLGKNANVDASSLNVFAAYSDGRGKLYFGSAPGYYSFNPSEISIRSKAPEILFTNFSLGRETIKPSTSGPLKQELWKTTGISLAHNQNVFSFDFVPIDYHDPTENHLAYKLENYDDDWRPTANPGRAYYFNVPAGKYIFKVKALNSAGVWSEKDISVVIAPPWWRSWWAWCLYCLVAIALGLALHRYQKGRVLQKERERTRAKELAQAKEIERAYNELKTTQTQLIEQAKMASLGELTAGIAHEIQNPLNFVNNFSEVNNELVDELKTELVAGNTQQAMELADDIKGNQEKINYHGKRADAIVRSMLQHSRISSGHKEPTDINALADEYLRLAYHGLRAKDKSFNADFKTDFDSSMGKINVIPQDIGRVLLNLINNAFYAVHQKQKMEGAGYEPAVAVSTKRINGKVEIKVKDNGNGIPQKMLDKIFQPFFTTKPAGEGTGLGLSLAYDTITKGHGGALKVETAEGKGSEFIISLPASN